MQKLPSSPPGSVARLSISGSQLAALRTESLKEGELLIARVLSRSAKGKGEVILQIGDIKLSAQTKAAVKSGDVVNLKVVKVGQKLQFQIISLSETVDNAKQKPLQGVSPSAGTRADISAGIIKIVSLNPKFTPDNAGQIQARVLSTSSDGIVRLKIGDGLFEGYSARDLKPDQLLTLKMVTGGRQPQLQIISSVDARGVAPSTPSSVPLSNHSQIKLITPEILKDLVRGELVQAKVVANDVKGQLSLKIGDLVVKASTVLQTPKEQSLYLRVVKGGEGAVLEQLTHKEFNRELKMAAYRQVLPRQQSLVAGLHKLLDAGQGGTDKLPLTIKESIATLLKQLPNPDKVALPAELRQALSNTGLFTESKLVAGMLSHADLKVGLNQIISLIRPMLSNRQRVVKGDTSAGRTTSTVAQGALSPAQQSLLGELLRSSDGAMAKIQSQQLASLPQDDSGQQRWHFELPILNGEKLELFNIVVDRGAVCDKEEESTPWSITLQMNLTPLGMMRVQLQLKERAISTTFWAEEQQTLAILNRNISTLKDAFERAGLEVNGLRVLHGSIKPMKESVPDDLSLVNVKV